MFKQESIKHKIGGTILTYLTEPNELKKQTTVSEVYKIEDGSFAVITSLTPFYVKGGGQPSDEGLMTKEDISVSVNSVQYDNSGRVIHIIKEDISSFILPGDTVILTVDEILRLQNSAIHTGGELICAAVRTIGFAWEVVSAIHYPNNASVEFNVKLSENEREQFTRQLQTQLREMISMGNVVQIDQYIERKSVIDSCGYFPNYINVGEPIRVVKVWNGAPGRPCAGTHLKNINILKDVEITKVKNKKGILQVRYNTILNT